MKTGSLSQRRELGSASLSGASYGTDHNRNDKVVEKGEHWERGIWTWIQHGVLGKGKRRPDIS